MNIPAFIALTRGRPAARSGGWSVPGRGLAAAIALVTVLNGADGLAIGPPASPTGPMAMAQAANTAAETDLAQAAPLDAVLACAARAYAPLAGYWTGAGAMPMPPTSTTLQASASGLPLSIDRWFTLRWRRRVIRAYADLALNDGLIAETSKTLDLLRETEQTLEDRYCAMDATCDMGDLQALQVEILKVESELRSLWMERDRTASILNYVIARPWGARIGATRLPALAWTAQDTAQLVMRVQSFTSASSASFPMPSASAPSLSPTPAQTTMPPEWAAYAQSGSWTGFACPGYLAPGMFLASSDGAATTPGAAAMGWNDALALTAGCAGDAMCDQGIQLIGAATAIGDADIVAQDYGGRIIPALRELLATRRADYSSGKGDLLAVLETERALIDAEKTLLRASAGRLRGLADVGAITGEDMIRLAGDRSQPLP